MNRNVITAVLASLYFVAGPFATLSLAVKSATALVEARHVSNFEGASGYATMYQTPIWWLLYMALLVAAFVLLRRRPWLLAAAAAMLVVLSMPSISFIANLAWDISLPAGPLGRL
jgi:hypothetical protein